MAQDGSTNLLKGIVYSEFDNHVGPVIRFLFPDSILSKESIEVISDYIVLEKHLCNEIILLNVGQLHFLLMCMNIDNKKYERNSFTFSFGLVMSEQYRNPDTDINIYHRLLRNLTTFFYDLELESEFLSQSATKLKLFEILKLIYENFRFNHSCFLTIESNVMNPSTKNRTNFYLPLQLFAFPDISEQVYDFDVPLFRCDKIQLSQLTYDISFRHVALYIDGVSHVKKIAKDVNMDLHFVKKAIALLLYYNLIIVGDVFRFSNIYVCQCNPTEIPESVLKEVKEFACLEFASASISTSNAFSAFSPTTLQKLDLMTLLAKLQPRVNIGQAILSSLNTQSQLGEAESEGNKGSVFLENVNVQRLIAICLERKIVRRLYEYPVFLKSTSSGASLPSDISTDFATSGEDKAEESPDLSHFATIQSRTPRKTQFPSTSPSTNSMVGESRTFSKITSKAKSVLSQSYLKESTTPDLTELIQSLDGCEHLDAICCKYEIPLQTITNASGVRIIYK